MQEFIEEPYKNKIIFVEGETEIEKPVKLKALSIHKTQIVNVNLKIFK